MSYLGKSWLSQATAPGWMGSEVSRFLSRVGDATEEGWQQFFADCEPYMRKFAKYRFRSVDLAAAEEVYHDLVCDLKPIMAQMRHRPKKGFRSALVVLYRDRLVTRLRQVDRAEAHRAPFAWFQAFSANADLRAYDDAYVKRCMRFINECIVESLDPMARELYGVTEPDREIWIRHRIDGVKQVEIVRETTEKGGKTSTSAVNAAVMKVDHYLADELKKLKDVRIWSVRRGL